MKKKYLLFLILLIPFNVKALSGSAYLDCNFNQSNTQISCNAYLKVLDGSTGGLQGIISLSPGLTLGSITPGNGWTRYSTYGTSFAFTAATSSGYTGSGLNPFNFVLSASNDYNNFTIELYNLLISDQSGDTTVSFNNTSKTLARSTQPITEPTTERPTESTTKQTTKTTTTTTKNNYLYMKTEPTTEGPNIVFDISTTKSRYSTTTYPTLKDSTLLSLTIENHSINFLPQLYTYNLVIGANETAINLNYELTNPSYKAIVTGVNNLQMGFNKATITITDNNGDTTVYTINIYRGDTVLNGDATLKKITIEKYNLNFYSDVHDYDLIIRNDKKLKVTAIPNASTTTYQVSGNDSVKDNSMIIVKTIAQNNSSIEYRITVHYAVKTISPYLVYIPLFLMLCGGAIIITLYIRDKKIKNQPNMEEKIKAKV
jgi:hypothetical protein